MAGKPAKKAAAKKTAAKEPEKAEKVEESEEIAPNPDPAKAHPILHSVTSSAANPAFYPKAE